MFVSDIEIVAEPIEGGAGSQRDLFGEGTIDGPTRLDRAIAAVESTGQLFDDPALKRDGVKAKRRLYTAHAIPVDLFIVRPPATWAVIYLIRTGSADFVRQVMQQLPDGVKSVDGRLVQDDGREVEVKTERDIFDVCRMSEVSPSARDSEQVARSAAMFYHKMKGKR